MIWKARPAEVAALGLLLDRTFAEARTAGEHPRRLDREFLIGQFDLWDNHLLPAVHAAAAPLHLRRAAAQAVWLRLGTAAEPAHRRWMSDHLGALGLDPALLGPGRPEPAAALDHAGRPFPLPRPLTRAEADLLLADYDLAGGGVAAARMEIDGGEPVRLHGYLALAAHHRRYTDDSAGTVPGPQVRFQCSEIESIGFPHGDRDAMRLTGQPDIDVTDDRARIDVATAGEHIRLCGRGITSWPDDRLWHESAAARGVDARGVHAEPHPDQVALPGSLWTLALLLHRIVLRLRMMRYAHELRRWELAAGGAMADGLGTETIRIAARLWPSGLRARAASRRLDALVAGTEGGPRALLRDAARDLPWELPEAAGPPPPVPERITVGTAGRLLDGLDLTGGRLRFVATCADRTVLHLEARRPDRETIVVVALSEPLGGAPLTATPGGLTLTGSPRIVATADDIELTIPLPGGDWSLRAAAGTWYAD